MLGKDFLVNDYIECTIALKYFINSQFKFATLLCSYRYTDILFSLFVQYLVSISTLKDMG